MENQQKVILNIGGQRFETNKTTLKKIPATRLSRLTEALSNYDKILNEYFFDRHPGVFSQILNYYRTGKLHYPTNVCGPLFEAELEFWGLDSNQVEPCCWKTYTKHRDTEETLATLEKLSLNDNKTSDEELAKLFGFDEDPKWQNGSLPFYMKMKPIIWQMFHESNSSKTAKAITLMSVFFIILSIINLSLATLNGFCKNGLFCKNFNVKMIMPQEYDSSLNLIQLSINRGERSINLFDYIEYICLAWFSFEFFVKSCVAPSKITFLKCITSWIDFFAILWSYMDIFYIYLSNKNDYERHSIWDLLGTVRVMRLFKLFNHYAGLTIIIASLKASAGILRLLFFFIGVAIIIFASLIYYSEKLAAGNDGRNGMSSLVGAGHQHGNAYGNDNQFNSIVEAIWFSIASLTTVGFGDFLPKTPFGMVFGAMCTVAGVLMIDLPMPIIVENFANYYKHLQASSKFPKKLRRNILPVETNRNRNIQSFNRISLNTIDSSINKNQPKIMISSKSSNNSHSIVKNNILDNTKIPLINSSTVNKFL